VYFLFVGLLKFSVYTIISLNRVNKLSFVIVKCHVFCKVRIEFLSFIYTSLGVICLRKCHRINYSARNFILEISDTEINALYNFLSLLQCNELYFSTRDGTDLGAFAAADPPLLTCISSLNYLQTREEHRFSISSYHMRYNRKVPMKQEQSHNFDYAFSNKMFFILPLAFLSLNLKFSS
jgi:hypothetical protein